MQAAQVQTTGWNLLCGKQHLHPLVSPSNQATAGGGADRVKPLAPCAVAVAVAAGSILCILMLKVLHMPKTVERHCKRIFRCKAVG